MRLPPPISISLKIASLLLAAAFLYGLWHTSAFTIPNAPDDDDIQVAPRVLVQTGKITRGTVRSYLNVFGRVEPAPARGDSPAASASISLPVGSHVLHIGCIEGQTVAKGDELLSVDVPDASGQVQTVKVVSPLSGTVTRLSVHNGDVTGIPNAPALEVVDLQRLVIAVDVPSRRLVDVRIGQGAEIIASSQEKSSATAPTTQPAPVMGTVMSIDAAVDDKTGMGSVDVSVSPDAHLRPGDFVRVRIVTAEHPDVLVAPVDSIVANKQGQSGISTVVRDFHWADRVPVQTGIRDGDMIEISGEGIKEGQDIVTVGAYALPDKSQIDVTVK